MSSSEEPQAHQALFKFAYIPRMDDTYAILAALTEPETWTGNPNHPNAILKNYITYTFYRLKKEDKIYFAPDYQWAAFNTGLLNRNAEDIFALFEAHNDRARQPWFFKHWTTNSDRQFMQVIKDPPKMADFVTPASNLVYDFKRSLTPNIEHIIDHNIDRFPRMLQFDHYATVSMFERAVKVAQKRLQRNYKLAVPHWYPTHGNMDVQLLLPLDLTNDGTADLALVVEAIGENSYRGSTVLTLDMAYSNARLVARPDSEWLKP